MSDEVVVGEFLCLNVHLLALLSGPRTMAAALLKDGRVSLKDCWSERTGKTYDATVVLEDNGETAHFKLVFGDA